MVIGVFKEKICKQRNLEKLLHLWIAQAEPGSDKAVWSVLWEWKVKK